MTPISSLAAAATPLPATTNTTPGGGDLLAAMRPAMDTAFRVGTPTNAEGAASVLATGGSYLQGASSTLAKLDEGIKHRREQLAHTSDPDSRKQQQEQLDLLQRLRDRIQLSIERVSDILAGKDRDDIGGPEDATPPRRTRDEDLELLEQRRRLLAPQLDATPGPDAAAAAGTYAAAATDPR